MLPSFWPSYLVSSTPDVGTRRHLEYPHHHHHHHHSPYHHHECPQALTSHSGDLSVNLCETSKSSKVWTACSGAQDLSSSPLEKNADVMDNDGVRQVDEEKTSAPKTAGASSVKFSIDNILGLHKTLPSANLPAHLAPSHSGFGCNLNAVGDDSRGDEQDPGGEEGVGTNTTDGDSIAGERSDDNNGYQWLQCTRYHPPKLQRNKKKDCGSKKRKFGRNPRVPFTQHQVAVLEERFRQTHYLSTMDVAELSAALTLSETRVKIWFQNRRARERREREASQRTQLLTQNTYQPLSIPSVTWALTSQLPSSSFSSQFRNEASFRPGLFTSAFSSFSAPLRMAAAAATAVAATATEGGPTSSCTWVECGSREEGSFC